LITADAAEPPPIFSALATTLLPATPPDHYAACMS